jgi:hypothetical protein
MNKAEPPWSPSSLFRVGKDSHGHWVVQDQQGLRGGLFVDRAQAIKFAMFENGNCPQAVIMVPGVLELDIVDPPPTARPATRSAALRRQRLV